VLVLAGTSGCDRNVEPYEEGAEVRPPDLTRIFPAPEDEEAPAQARQRPPPRAASGGPMAISGVIELAPTAAAAAGPGKVLFIVARPEGATGGPPTAAVRIVDPVFPVEFEIGPADVMMPNARFEGRMTLTARLDSDGNAMTREAGDLETAPIDSVIPGTTGIALQLGGVQEQGRVAARVKPAPTRPMAGVPPGGASITGTIHLAAGASADAASSATLFVIARPAGRSGGPPLAVVRHSSPSFPFEFEIGPDNVMIPTMRFEGEITLTARLDRDGDAMTRGADDLEATSPRSAEPGASDVRLELR
jgi:hypothetical protein